MIPNHNSSRFSIKDFCKVQWDQLCEEYINSPGASIIVSNCGKMTMDNMDSILYMIETHFAKGGEPKVISKRTFSIVAESCENIRRHSTNDPTARNLCYVIVAKTANGVEVNVGNYIDNQIVEGFQSSLKRLEGLTPDDLKSIYLNTLKTTEISEKGGAGLGIITIAMRSKNQVKFNFTQANDNLTLFNIKATISS
jgi:hypothetical protein